MKVIKLNEASEDFYKIVSGLEQSRKDITDMYKKYVTGDAKKDKDLSNLFSDITKAINKTKDYISKKYNH